MIKIGISCDNTNAKQIIQTFSEVRIFELCVPIIYDYSTVLSYYRKIRRLPIRTTNIHNANKSIKNSLNIIDISNKALPMTVGKTNIKSNTAIGESFYRGLSDLKVGEIDVFVTSSTSTDSIQQIESELLDEKKSLPILTNDYFRIAEISNSTPINIDILTEKIKNLHSTLLHDFMVTFPRIAIVSENSPAEIITDATQIAFREGIFCFSTFNPESFFNSDIYKKFDAALIINCMSTNFIFQSIQPVSEQTNAILISNMPYVVAIANSTSLTPSIYLAIDVYRNRKNKSDGDTTNSLKKVRIPSTKKKFEYKKKSSFPLLRQS